MERQVVVLNKLCKGGTLICYRLGLLKNGTCKTYVDVNIEFIYDILKIIGKENIVVGVIYEDSMGSFPVGKGCKVFRVRSQYDADLFLRKYYISSLGDIMAIEKSITKVYKR